MPANLSPEYREAEAAYRRARDAQEKLEHLREMLKTIPKHKGTEHLQADIKTRLKQLTEEVASGTKKGAARAGPTVAIRPEGAAQVAMLGPPNAGKSTLHDRLTGSGAKVSPGPFTTQAPQPGMMPFEDVQFQLVDLPPISADYMESWIVNALQPADAALLVVDLSDPECLEQVATIMSRLDEKRVTLTARFERIEVADDDEEIDPFRIYLPTLMVAAKADLLDDPQKELETFMELAELDYPAVTVTADSSLERIGAMLFELLGVVRVYTKQPGKPADNERPFTLRRGDTVRDVARMVHRGLAQELKFARLWGRGAQFDGQQVGRDHVLADRDVIEIH
jgi:ribosome-interacting GTPase 1